LEEFVKVTETAEVPLGKMKKVTVDGKEILIVNVEGKVKVTETGEVPLGKMKKVTVDGKEILIVNVEGKYHAIGNKCTHTTGEVAAGPAKKSEPTFEVKVEGKNVLLQKS